MAVLWTSLAAIGLAANEPATARLLVNIVVDGLDGDYLDLLRYRFADGGFRLLEDRGASMVIDYGTPLDATAATSVISTGGAPSVSGIEGRTFYNSETLRREDVFADAQVLGNFTASGYSPKALRISTLSDEANIASGGTNNVYSIALTPGEAISMGGHGANAAIWLDTGNGNWASSTAYPELPAVIAKRNRALPLSSRLDTMVWTSMLPPEAYPALPNHLKRHTIHHVFPHDNLARFEMFAASPLFNREVSDIAGEILTKQKLGTHEGITDVLNISYRLQPYNYGKETDNRAELMDAYMRLDNDLATLFRDINRSVGLHNTVIMLAGTPPGDRRRRDDEQWKIPYGEFSTRRAASLLNVYFIALYGNGNYVSGISGNQVYLNTKFIEDNKLNLRQMRTEAASLLARMTGIDRAYTIDDIIEGRAGENAHAIRRNTVVSHAGDVVLVVAPGFELIDDFSNPVPGMARTGMIYTTAIPQAPAFIFAPAVPQQSIGTPVDARAIAPTVARLLHIRSPNGAGAAPLLLKK